LKRCLVFDSGGGVKTPAFNLKTMNVEYMIKYVEAYILHRKQKQVTIDRNNIDIMKLISAYNYATRWINEHSV